MSGSLPIIQLDGSTSVGGGASTTNAVGSIANDYAELIAQGSNAFQGTGATLFHLSSGAMAMASTAQIGRVINGVTITAAIVAENQALLNAIGAYCRSHNIGIVVEAQLDNPPSGDWTYQWLQPAVKANLPIVQVEDDMEPELNSTLAQLNQKAQYMTQSVAQIVRYFPNVKIGTWAGGSPQTAASFWSDYDVLAKNLNLPKISYAVADTSWNAPWVTTPATWQSWLQQLSGQVQNQGMTLTVMVDGVGTDTTGSQWTAQSQQHAAMLAQIPGVNVNCILVRSWQPGQPNAVLPLNQPSTIGNDALMIASTYSLYQQSMITASGAATISAPGQVIVGVGAATLIDGVAVSLGAADLAADVRIAVVITANSAMFSARACGEGVISGSGTTTIVLDGTQADINAMLQTLSMSEPVGGPDTLDIEIFGVNGRLADQQISVLATPSGATSPSQTLVFLPATANGGSNSGWTQATAAITGGRIASENFLWNQTDQNAASGSYLIIKEDAVHLPLEEAGIVYAGGIPKNPGANSVGSNPLSTGWNYSAFNPSALYSDLNVVSTSVVFNSISGYAESITDILAPYTTASGGQANSYLSTNCQQITYENIGSNPLWQAAWGNLFGSVVMTYGSQGQLLEQVFVGTVRNNFQTVDNVFDPLTGKLWETIESYPAPSQSSSFVSGTMTITQFNTGDNPNWDTAEWGSLNNVTATWQDFYTIGVGPTPTAPILTNWLSGIQFNQTTWYSGSPQTGGVFCGLGSPGDTITISTGNRLIGSGTVGSKGQWTLSLSSGITYGRNIISIAQSDASGRSSTSATVWLQVGGGYSASAADVVTNLDTLQALAHIGAITAINLTDGGTPTLAVSAVQMSTDANALALISSPHKLGVTGATAAMAAGMVNRSNIDWVLVSDTAARVAANLSSLQALMSTAVLTSVTLTDSGIPTFALSAAQVNADGAVLLRCSQYNLAVAGGSAVNLAVLQVLASQKLNTVTFTDSPPTFAVSASQLTSYANLLARISSPYALTVKGATAANAAAAAAQPHVASVAVSDTAAQVVSNLSGLQALAVRGKLGAITLTDRGKPTLSLSATQLTTDASALASIGSPYNLAVTAVAAAKAATTAGQPNVAALAVSDTAANVAANLDALQALEAGGKLAAITLTDSGKPSLALSAAQLAADASALGSIGSSYSLRVTGVTAVNAAGVAAQPNVALVAVSDTAADVAANLGALQALEASGKLAGITLTDSGNPALSLSAAQLAAYASTLARIGSSYSLTVTDVTATNATSMATQPNVSSISVSGGKLAILAGGVASGAVVSSGGVQVITSGGVVSGTVISNGGREYALAGGDCVGTVVRSGGNLTILAGGIASGTALSSGGVELITSGGVASGTQVSSGGNQFISAGGVASGTVISNGGREYACSGGDGVGTVVLSGGNLTILAGGVASGTVVSSGGNQFISAGGVASGTVISNGGREYAYSGGDGVGTVVQSEGNLTVLAGGVATGTVLSSGGVQMITSGGVTSGTVVSNGGREYAFSGGDDVGAVVLSGGNLTIMAGGVTSGTVLSSGGVQMITSGGVTSGTVISNGGQEYAYTGGYDVGAVVRSGGNLTISAGVATGTMLSSGGQEYVYTGGDAVGAAVLPGGSLSVSAGGVVSGTALSSGGVQMVCSGGVASGTLISGGGVEYVYSGGIDRGAIISSGGLAFIVSGGAVSGGTVISGATLTVSSGGVVQAGLTLSGGTAVISGTAAAGQQIGYAGPGGDLALGNLAGFAAVISGFSTSDAIDLLGFGYSGIETRSFAEAASNTSGTLTVLAGAKTASLTLLGSYVTSNFALSADGGTGTFVKFA